VKRALPLHNFDLNSNNSYSNYTHDDNDSIGGKGVVSTKPVTRHGRWLKEERLAFLRGLRVYGKGNWKQIATLIPTRDTIQTKTHAQVAMKKFASGENIFEELDYYERRFISAEEDRKLDLVVGGAKQRNAGMTTPTFVWKPDDYESAKILMDMRNDTLACLF
jgi:hypothetical protein